MKMKTVVIRPKQRGKAGSDGKIARNRMTNIFLKTKYKGKLMIMLFFSG